MQIIMVKADNFIYWIILYPVDKRFPRQVICFICYLIIHPLDNLPVFCITGARKFENPDFFVWVYTVLVVRGGVATMWGPFEVRNFLFFFFFR